LSRSWRRLALMRSVFGSDRASEFGERGRHAQMSTGPNRAAHANA